MNLGAFEYINKPVKIDELKSILKKIFKETSHGFTELCILYL